MHLIPVRAFVSDDHAVAEAVGMDTIADLELRRLPSLADHRDGRGGDAVKRHRAAGLKRGICHGCIEKSHADVRAGFILRRLRKHRGQKREPREPLQWIGAKGRHFAQARIKPIVEARGTGRGIVRHRGEAEHLAALDNRKGREVPERGGRSASLCNVGAEMVGAYSQFVAARLEVRHHLAKRLGVELHPSAVFFLRAHGGKARVFPNRRGDGETEVADREKARVHCSTSSPRTKLRSWPQAPGRHRPRARRGSTRPRSSRSPSSPAGRRPRCRSRGRRSWA